MRLSIVGGCTVYSTYELAMSLLLARRLEADIMRIEAIHKKTQPF